MITIENTEVVGLEHAIRGMRNPMNSWDKSDSKWDWIEDPSPINPDDPGFTYVVGPNDHDLMMRLCKAGAADAKFRRMIICYADITAPLYMLKEMDTYRMGVEKNSCSTMHKIQAKEFAPDDFSHEHLFVSGDLCCYSPNGQLNIICETLNKYRDKFLETKDKAYWWQMIQLLPSSYNQRRTYMFSYEALSKIYRERRNHKLDEWHQFCDWVETLPYSEIITLKEAKSDE